MDAIFNFYNNENIKFENITFTSIIKIKDIKRIRSYFNFDKNYAIFENCKFIDTYSRQYIIERFRSDLTINNCYFTSTNGNVGYEVIGGYKNSVLLINNIIFKNCCRKSDDNIDVYGNCSIFNSQFLEYENPHLI